jgi:LmbE family N-acetylglucosaminyl deacetylase
MTPNRRLLAVLAHPDDESFGIGGTLARYADEGADVHIAIATDCVAGSVADGYEHTLVELAAVRHKELETAAAVAHTHTSATATQANGDPANQHPDAFHQRRRARAVGVAELIRRMAAGGLPTTRRRLLPSRPHLLLKITAAAFDAAADPAAYPELGLPPYRPQRLYYTGFSNRMVKVFTWIMRLRGQDPKRAGRNKDIDWTRIGIEPRRLHAHIDYRRYWDAKRTAGAAHASGRAWPAAACCSEPIQRRWMAGDAYPRLPARARCLSRVRLFAGVVE